MVPENLKLVPGKSIISSGKQKLNACRYGLFMFNFFHCIFHIYSQALGYGYSKTNIGAEKMA
jgi:hypothetical protein